LENRISIVNENLSSDEKFPNITKESSVEELAEAVKKLRTETPEVDEKINLSTKPQVKSLTITPAAGFAYKTTRLSDKKKVFINIPQISSSFKKK
jgi:predicted mannosyl-3-phosphoglycerate phosphatase (HAD superfamily)